MIATVHGETLHNHHHGNILKSGDLFLLDAGAETAMHYAGDLSSTFPVDPKFTDRQKTIYDIALAAYRAAVDTIAPGVPNLEVHLAAARTIAVGMKDLGLMKGDPDDAVAAGAHAMFFPCGIGHMMGLDVHDMEDLGEVHVGYGGRPEVHRVRPEIPASGPPPGAGFRADGGAGHLLHSPADGSVAIAERFTEFLDYDELDKWRDFGGVRNEENYLVTADGKRRLGKPKPLTTRRG